MTRVQATVALLQALNDYFPDPETWTGQLQRRATNAGPAPSRRVVCEECEGRGKTRSGWLCSSCKGRGVYDVDDYTGEPVDSSLTPFAELLARFVNCPCCGGWGRLSADSNLRPTMEHALCDECNGTGKVAAPFTGVFRADSDSNSPRIRQEDRTLDALADGQERRDGLRVYRDELLPALEHLKRLDAYGHLLVQWVWIMGACSPAALTGAQTRRLMEATLTLAAGMPDRFERRLPGEIRAQHAHREASLARAKGKRADRFAQRKRDEEIRRLHSRGLSLDELASRFSLDKSRVSRITRAA